MHTPSAQPALPADEVAHLISICQRLGARGWTPATSSNFSMRASATRVLITISGRDKSTLSAADLMLVDDAGQSLVPGMRASAETALHLQIYQRFPTVTTVLHTHSVTQTVASRLFEARGEVSFSGYEMQKALGAPTHEGSLKLPVVPNSQQMEELCASVAPLLADANPVPGYLIAGHGLYAWGQTPADALRHVEALEFLLSAELEHLRLHLGASRG